jgi:signal transduction histidine kinase
MQYHKKIYRKNTLLSIIVVSILFVLALLAYSLYSQYNYLSKIVFTSYNESLNLAINQYRSSRFDQISGGGSIRMEISDWDARKDTSQVFTIDEISYLLNSVLIAQTPFELGKLDSIYSTILKESEIESAYNIIVFKHKSDSVLEQSNVKEPVFYKFHTARKGLDSERDVQVYFKNPGLLILEKMALSFVFSFGMLVIIIIVLAYQSRIIAEQKKIETIRQDFIDSMTHELRQPLQGALSLSEIIDNEKIAGNNSLRSNIIGRLKTNLQNLEMLLQSLVVQSYAENLQTTAHWQQGNLKNCMDEIITACSLSSTKLIHFKTNYSDDITACWFDLMHFPHAIKNLIENAIKYSNEEVSIDIQAVIKNNFIEVTVSDNGTGIAKEDLPHIFRKFYKGTHGKKNYGFGLGLSYVKWVCDIHDGQVTVTSTTGKGSVFKLVIPNFITNGRH